MGAARRRARLAALERGRGQRHAARPACQRLAFRNQLPDGGPLLRSTLVDVRPNAGFTDETAFEGVIMRVAHLLAPQPEGGVRVTYRTEVDGPGAAGVGADVSADFPDVLAALKRAAEAPTV